MNQRSARLILAGCQLTAALMTVAKIPAFSQQIFQSLGCGSGCSIDYFTIKSPYRGADGITKVLVREVTTSGGGGGSPLIRKAQQVWILADCKKGKINLSSMSSNGRGSHRDALGWVNINYDGGTNYDYAIKEIYGRLCS